MGESGTTRVLRTLRSTFCLRALTVRNYPVYYLVSTDPVEEPYLPLAGGLGHAVSVVVEQHALVLGVAPQRAAQLLHLWDKDG